jgi:hypothetical protein
VRADCGTRIRRYCREVGPTRSACVLCRKKQEHTANAVLPCGFPCHEDGRYNFGRNIGSHTRQHISKDGTLHNHCLENLKVYRMQIVLMICQGVHILNVFLDTEDRTSDL